MERNNGCYYCHKKVPVKLKAMLYQAVFKPTMVYGAECWAMRTKEEHLVNKTRMLRWIHGISLKDNTAVIMSDAIRKRANKANCSSCYQTANVAGYTKKRPWGYITSKIGAREGYTWI